MFKTQKGTSVKYAAVLLAALVAGCSALQAGVAHDSEEILALAGFERQPLNEPGLPSRQLLADGDTYKFADPDFCACVYVGGAKEYAELQKLRADRIAEREWILRHSSYGNSYSPLVWGAWKPQGLDVVEPAAVGR
jgi:hypothetical protein